MSMHKQKVGFWVQVISSVIDSCEGDLNEALEKLTELSLQPNSSEHGGALTPDPTKRHQRSSNVLQLSANFDHSSDASETCASSRGSHLAEFAILSVAMQGTMGKHKRLSHQIHQALAPQTHCQAL